VFKQKCVELQRQNDLLALKLSKIVRSHHNSRNESASKLKILGSSVELSSIDQNTVEDLIRTLEENKLFTIKGVKSHLSIMNEPSRQLDMLTLSQSADGSSNLKTSLIEPSKLEDKPQEDIIPES